MKRDVFSEHASAGPPGTLGQGPAQDEDALRCAICDHRLGSSIIFLEETGDVPEPRQSWMVCGACDAAVKERLAASPLRSPLRLRVAVGLVASERTPTARRAKFWDPSDAAWAKIFLWLFLITMLVHLAVIVAVAGITR
ncbi:MAG TPA: hypothetical protein VLJ14_15405 [Ktedonobacterales bacterium]|jgi:hypothetical protein|nr:hypothetical protein [Ktedonobacterales bacterium]